MSNPSVPAIPRTKTSLLKTMYKYRWAYILLIPVIAFFIVFHYVPMYGIVLAFKKYAIRKGILGSPWIGLTNFERLFGSAMFLRTVRNTVLISAYRIIFGLPTLPASELNPVMIGYLKKALTMYRAKRYTGDKATRDFYEYQILRIDNLLNKRNN